MITLRLYGETVKYLSEDVLLMMEIDNDRGTKFYPFWFASHKDAADARNQMAAALDNLEIPYIKAQGDEY